MKKSITGTAKVVSVCEGLITLKYDKDIVKWFKKLNPDEVEVVYMNYEIVSRKISKLAGIELEETVDYPYWDYHYTHFMDFYTYNWEVDKQIKKALKNEVFTIKLKAIEC